MDVKHPPLKEQSRFRNYKIYTNNNGQVKIVTHNSQDLSCNYKDPKILNKFKLLFLLFSIILFIYYYYFSPTRKKCEKLRWHLKFFVLILVEGLGVTYIIFPKYCKVFQIFLEPSRIFQEPRCFSILCESRKF